MARAVAAERGKGTAAAVALTMAKGDAKVADLEYQMEVAKVKSEMHGEYSRAYKTEANFIEDDIRLIWGGGGK